MDPAIAEPFKATEIQVMDVSYVDKVALDAANSYIFKGSFFDKEQKKVGMMVLLESFFALH